MTDHMQGQTDSNNEYLDTTIQVVSIAQEPAKTACHWRQRENVVYPVHDSKDRNDVALKMIPPKMTNKMKSMGWLQKSCETQQK